MNKNDLYWNRHFGGEQVVIQLPNDSGFTQKSAIIAPMNATSFLGYPLKAVKIRQDTVWIVDRVDDYEATHIDANQIIWFKNEQLQLLYGKT